MTIAVDLSRCHMKNFRDTHRRNFGLHAGFLWHQSHFARWTNQKPNQQTTQVMDFRRNVWLSSLVSPLWCMRACLPWSVSVWSSATCPYKMEEHLSASYPHKQPQLGWWTVRVFFYQSLPATSPQQNENGAVTELDIFCRKGLGNQKIWRICHFLCAEKWNIKVDNSSEIVKVKRIFLVYFCHFWNRLIEGDSQQSRCVVAFFLEVSNLGLNKKVKKKDQELDFFVLSSSLKRVFQKIGHYFW